MKRAVRIIPKHAYVVAAVTWIGSLVALSIAAVATQAGKDVLTYLENLSARAHFTVSAHPAARTSPQTPTLPISSVPASFSATYTAPFSVRNGNHHAGTGVEFTVQASEDCVLGDPQFQTEPLGEQGLMRIKRTKESPSQDLWEIAYFPKNVTFSAQYPEICTREIEGQSLVVTLSDRNTSKREPSTTHQPLGDDTGETQQALNQWLNTPFQSIPERADLAATNWAIVAEQGNNPLVSPSPGADFSVTSDLTPATENNWGGWYFMNGVLGASDRQASPTWGTQQNAGYDLTGATKIQFLSKGVNGDENVEFLSFCFEYDPVTGTQLESGSPFDSVERNAAFVYDNAAEMISLIAASHLDHADTIPDALLYAQSNDRFFTDGRVRNAYQGGDIILPPGWLPNNKLDTVRMPGLYDAARATWFEDETQASGNAANVTRSMRTILYLYETTHDQKYLQAADQLGNWTVANTSDISGNGSFTGGYDGWENGAARCQDCAPSILLNGQCKLFCKSTEHNIDPYSAFSCLRVAEKRNQRAQAPTQIKTFVLSMWDPVKRKFWAGTDEGGVNAATCVMWLSLAKTAVNPFHADIAEKHERWSQAAQQVKIGLRSVDVAQIDNAAPPLIVKLLKNGGAHLIIVDNVVTKVGVGNVLPIHGCELDEKETRLMVNVLKSGGAHLTVSTPLGSTVNDRCGIR